MSETRIWGRVAPDPCACFLPRISARVVRRPEVQTDVQKPACNGSGGNAPLGGVGHGQLLLWRQWEVAALEVKIRDPRPHLDLPLTRHMTLTPAAALSSGSFTLDWGGPLEVLVTPTVHDPALSLHCTWWTTLDHTDEGQWGTSISKDPSVGIPMNPTLRGC